MTSFTVLPRRAALVVLDRRVMSGTSRAGGSTPLDEWVLGRVAGSTRRHARWRESLVCVRARDASAVRLVPKAVSRACRETAPAVPLDRSGVRPRHVPTLLSWPLAGCAAPCEGSP